MRFRPCIDLHDGKVKQIVGKTLAQNCVQENFSSEKDACWFAQIYKEHDLYDGHVIMLGQSDENKSAAIRALNSYPSALQIGGGMNLENAQYWLDQGASALIFSSWLIKDNLIDFEKLERLRKSIGKEKIIIDLSCIEQNNQYYFAFNRWETLSHFEIKKENFLQLKEYCKEVLIHAVDVEGTKSGVDHKLINLLSSIGNQIKIVYAGGINSLEDIQFIQEKGDNLIDFTVGSALDLFGGHLPFSTLSKYKD